MITIGLIDDHELFRVSLKQFLNNFQHFEVSLEAENGLDFFKKIEAGGQIPNVVITDFQMPKMNGKAVLKKLKEQYPSIKVVVLSVFEHDHLLKEMMGMGASGFLVKSISIQFLIEAIEEISNGRIVMSNGDKIEIVNMVDWNCKELNVIHLTERQVEFLKLCALPNFTYKEIADYMQISPKTVDRYRDELFKKLGVNSRAGLLLYAMERGLCKIH